MAAPPVVFTTAQQMFIEDAVPSVCERGGWTFIACAAGPDHVHILLRADIAVHGKQVRKWLKRWLTEALNTRWVVPQRHDGMSWFCEGGSTKAVKDDRYFANVIAYILCQRATPLPMKH